MQKHVVAQEEFGESCLGCHSFLDYANAALAKCFGEHVEDAVVFAVRLECDY